MAGLLSLVLLLAACQAAPASAPPAEPAPSQQQVQVLQEELQGERAQREKVEEQFQESQRTLEIRTAMLEGLLAETQAMDQLQESKEELERTIATVQDAAKALDNDRQLLIQLRKDPPPTKTLALEHWRGIKALAVKSDPSLARPVDRVLSAADPYYTWSEKQHSSNQEALQDYYASGADQYSTQMEELNKAVLLVLIFRIDAIIQQTGSGQG